MKVHCSPSPSAPLPAKVRITDNGIRGTPTIKGLECQLKSAHGHTIGEDSHPGPSKVPVADNARLAGAINAGLLTVQAEILCKDGQTFTSSVSSIVEIPEGTQFKVRMLLRANQMIPESLVTWSLSKWGVDAENDYFHFGPIHPTKQLHVVEYPLNTWAEAPSGFMMRGKYTARMMFTNLSGNTIYLDWECAINIRAAYAAPSSSPDKKGAAQGDS